MKPLLKVHNLVFKYHEAPKHTLADIHFEMYIGQLCVIIGGNGSGKSTLLKIIAGVFKEYQGQITFADNDIRSTSTHSDITYCTQHASDGLFSELTVYDQVCLWHLSLFGLTTALPTKNMVKKLLEEYHPQLPERLDNSVSSLSGGEKQMLVLALIFIKPPKLLLLDEPTSALDVHTAQRAIHLIKIKAREHNCTVLMISHNVEEIQHFAERALVLKDGVIVGDYNKEQCLSLELSRII